MQWESAITDEPVKLQKMTVAVIRGLDINSAVNTIVEIILQTFIDKRIDDDIDITRGRFDDKELFFLGVVPADFSFGGSFCKVR